MSALEMRFLGGLELQPNKQYQYELRSQKGKALLCYLAVSGKVPPRTQLAGLLWPDMPDQQALMNLRKTLHRLKPVSPYLVASRGTVSFNWDVPHRLDVGEFQALADNGGDARSLRQAAALYRGDFLDGFYARGAPLFEEWVLAERARLRETALHALQRLIAHCDAEHAYDDALAHAQRFLIIEPYHEDMQRQCLRFLALTGQRGAALSAYESWREMLAADLDAQPSPSTTQVYEEIRAGSWPAEESGQLLAAPRHNLPLQRTPFVGRMRELATLERYLGDSDVRLINVLGPGGMGKTRLALAAANAQVAGRDISRHFPHGVYFVSLAGVETADLLPAAIALEIGFQFHREQDGRAQLLRHLRSKKMLLLLDNFEHLREGVHFIGSMLNEAPGLKLLVTSRERLKLRAEQLLPIDGLAYPQAGQMPAPNQAQKYSAVQLFLQEARRGRPAFALTEANRRHVFAICRSVAGMPLGIVLAAAWLDMLAPAEIASEIGEDVSFLQTEMGDVPDRQRSLGAAFNHSWRMLSEEEQRIYCGLSLFRGGFGAAAARAVTGATLRDLHVLANKSLLVRLPEQDNAAGRYEIHELLRQFAAQKLQQRRPLYKAARDAHCRYYCALVQRQGPHWRTERQLEAQRIIAREADNMNVAWRRALQTEEWESLSAAMDSWFRFLTWRGRYADGEAQSAALVARLAELPRKHSSHLILWSKALAWQGDLANSSDETLQRLQQSLALLDSPQLANQDVRREKACALRLLGRHYNGVDRKMARRCAEKSLRLYRELDDDAGTAICQTILGRLDWGMGRYEPARARTQAALAIFKEMGDRRRQLEPATILGNIEEHQGNGDAAETLRYEILDLCRQIDHPGNLIWLTAELAYTQLFNGRVTEGLRTAEQALAMCREYGLYSVEGYIRLSLGFGSLLAGRYDSARRELPQALAIVQKAGALGIEASVHCWLGFLEMVDGADAMRARRCFEEGRRLYEAVEDNYLANAHIGLGYAACKELALDEARRHIVESLKFCQALGDSFFLSQTLPLAALYLAQQGEVIKAIELWEQARGSRLIRRSAWHDQIVGREIKKRSAALTVDSIDAARARGRSLDLWQTAEALLANLHQ